MKTSSIHTPTERLSVDQLNRTFRGADNFTFDIAHKDGMLMEMYEVVGEVIDGDIYGLSWFTDRGDVWVDAGCHIGLFSIAAMMAGADVSVMVDMDNTMAFCADANARAFLNQQMIRGDLKTRRIRPIGWLEEITDAESLIEIGMLTRELWDGETGRRAMLKLDVQGSEMQILDGSGARDLASAFDGLVMEWHDASLDHLLPVLEDGGWRIQRTQKHTDVLLNTDTHIVWATSG